MVRVEKTQQEGTGFWSVLVTLDGNIQGRGFSSDLSLAIKQAVARFRGRRRPIPLNQIPRSIWRVF